MITKKQKEIIDSLKSQFKAMNESKGNPNEELLNRIKNALQKHDNEVKEFLICSQAYRSANLDMFRAFAEKLQWLCFNLNLGFEAVEGGFNTTIGTMTITFPHIKTSNATISIEAHYYHKNLGIHSGIAKTDLGIKLGCYFYCDKSFRSLQESENEIFEKISELIITSTKRYK